MAGVSGASAEAEQRLMRAVYAPGAVSEVGTSVRCMTLAAVPEITDHTDLALLSDAAITDEIVTWAGRIAAGEARLLLLIGELDARQAWFAPGFKSCAHWLSWRLGLGLTAARERVRISRALRELPRTTEAFAAGRMSYAQVRAVTRAATPSDEQTWVDLAPHTTGSQLERLARGVARVHRQEEDAADPERAAWRNRLQTRYEEDGTFVLTYRGSAEDGAVVMAAIDGARDALDRERRASAEASRGARTGEPQLTGETDEPQPAATSAEAMLRMARMALGALSTDNPAAARRHRDRLTAQVDPLSGWGRLRDGELLPPTSLRAVLRTLPGKGALHPIVDRDLTEHDQGRRARHPSQALRELLGRVDGERCRFPGCTHRRFLHAHHVRFWQDGGSTDLGNLILLCSHHHNQVHEHGILLELAADRALTVTTADGTALPHHPATPWSSAEALGGVDEIGPGTLQSGASPDRMDLGYAVMVLCQQAA